jgi:uncharacterized protein DUF4159
MRMRIAVACALALLVGSIAAAQLRPRGRYGYSRSLPYAKVEDFDGSFQFCRVEFRQVSDGDGGNWSVDYPRADENLSIRLSELTKTPVSMDSDGTPKHLLINLANPELFHCPFIMMTEVGSIYLDDAEVKGLREYLLKGGFLWADDFWGNWAWEVFQREIRKVLPPRTYPTVDLPIDHPIFHSLMSVQKLPQIPSINFWYGTRGQTSERGPESATPHARAILDDHQRVMVFITHNTDFGDAFEREGDNHQYFLTFSVPGYAVGVNVLLYALTH